jgi:ABC-type lipoprotein release transport system permease subunit
MQSLLFGIRPLDAVTFTAVPAVLFGVALLASWLPASRASDVEPSEALRSE